MKPIISRRIHESVGSTINGKEVYSDKKVSSIIETRVTFSDGSWCDIASGQIVNKGQGYVNIGSPEGTNNEKVTVGPKAYASRKLEVRDVTAEIDIQIHDVDQMLVTLVGPNNEVKTIQVSQQGDTIVIEGDSDQASGTTIISGRGNSVTRVSGGNSIFFGSGTIIRRSGGTIIAGNSNYIISGGGENQTKITVKVPKGASVNLSGVSGNTVIGDTDGILQVSSSVGNVNAGRVASATLNVQGSSDINVLEVNGVLTMSVMGSGDVRVDGGLVSTLSINVMGSGNATFNGEAESASLTVMGSGDIRVRKVKNRPARNVMGSGNIRVG